MPTLVACVDCAPQKRRKQLVPGPGDQYAGVKVSLANVLCDEFQELSRQAYGDARSGRVHEKL